MIKTGSGVLRNLAKSEPTIPTMRIHLLAAAAATALILTSCGSEDSNPGIVGSDSGDEVASTADESDGEVEAPEVEIVDYAFVQSREYVKGIALVRANNDEAIGKFVTLSYNVLDADGQILATEDQVESFSWVGQEIGFPFFVSLDATPNAKAASVDPAVSVGGDSYDERPADALPVLEAQSIVKDQYDNGFTVSFGFTNETDEGFDSLRVAAVCYDKSGKIIGGDTTYPDALPGRAIRIDVDYLTTVDNQKPATCKGYLNYPA